MMIVSGAKARIVTATPTITAGAYSAADAVGGKLTFFGHTRRRDGWGWIVGWSIFDRGAVGAALSLHLFHRDFTAVADNAVFAISDADAANVLCTFVTGTYRAFATTSSHYTEFLAAPIQYRLYNDQYLYGQLVCTATPSYTSTGDLTVKLHLLEA